MEARIRTTQRVNADEDEVPMHALYVRQTIAACNTGPTSTRLWETSTEEAPGAGKHAHINHTMEFLGAGMSCLHMARVLP